MGYIKIKNFSSTKHAKLWKSQPRSGIYHTYHQQNACTQNAQNIIINDQEKENPVEKKSQLTWKITIS